jgi:hypothetical protein
MNPHHPIDPCHYHPCAEVPEPGAFLMLCLGLAAIALFVWLKKGKR